MTKISVAAIMLNSFVLTATVIAQFGGNEPEFKDVLQGGPWHRGKYTGNDGPIQQAIRARKADPKDFLEAESNLKWLGWSEEWRFTKDGSFSLVLVNLISWDNKLGRTEIVDRGHQFNGTYRLVRRKITDNERSKMFTPRSRYWTYNGLAYLIEMSFTDQKGKAGTITMALNEETASKYKLTFYIANVTGVSDIGVESNIHGVYIRLKNKG